jgi:hypothetical protein
VVTVTVVVMVGAITEAEFIIMDGVEAEATIMVGGIIIEGDPNLCSEEVACLAAFFRYRGASQCRGDLRSEGQGLMSDESRLTNSRA